MNTQPLSRREILGLASTLGVSFALPGLDLQAAAERGPERAKSFLLVWLDGGPSQLETWDPHPGGPIGGPTRTIKTSLQGVEIADTFPRIAEQLHHLSVIRSLVSKEGDHARGAYTVKTGYRPDPALRHPSIGAVITQALPDSRLEIPQFIALGPNPWPSRGGYLGSRLDAFHVSDPASRARSGGTADPRQQRRIGNLQVLSEAFASGRQAAVAETLHDEHLRTVLKMMTSDQLEAFALDSEPAAVRTAYGNSDFGRACMVARRLIETGVRVVEVALGGFDTHVNNFTRMPELAAQLDPALAAIVSDLAARDLLESTAILCIGEFGRTPVQQPNTADIPTRTTTGYSKWSGRTVAEVAPSTDHTGKAGKGS